MSKKYRKVISVFIAALMLSTVSLAPVKAYADSNDIVYIALGDSVAYGMSASVGNGYTELLKSYLDGNPTGTPTLYQNLSLPGFTAGDLYRQVKNNNYAQTIAKADIITVNIGGNNILGAVIGVVKGLYGNLDSLEDLNNTINDNPTPLLLFMNKLTDPASAESNALNRALIAGVSSFNLYYPLLMKELRTLAPNAEIYVNTLYNPVPKDQALFLFLQQYISSINIPIRGYQFRYGYKVVDVYSAFAVTRQTVVDFNISGFSAINVDIHPNDAGHRLIFNTLKLRLRTAGSKYYYR